MLRYVKADGKWIDTMSELRDHGIVIMCIDGMVINALTDEIIGKMEDDSDTYSGILITTSKPPKISYMDVGIWRRITGK